MKNLLVFAGANGAGKSTITSKVGVKGVYTNADLIEKELGCTPMEAAVNVQRTRESLLENGEDFTIETVLSTTRYIDMMRRAKGLDYYIACIYVLTYNPEINVSRVIARANAGAQPLIDPQTVRKRYWRGLKLIPMLPDICDELYIFDNSPERGSGEPSLIISIVNGSKEIYPNEIWSIDMIEALLKGEYPDFCKADEK